MAEANFHGLKPVHLIVLPLVMLTLMGLLYNSFSASGLVVTQQYNCNFGNYLNCAGNQPVGCAVVPCGPMQAISFFNPNSPFTRLITQGNLFALFSSVTTTPNPQDVQPFPNTGQNAYYPVNCEYVGTGSFVNLGSGVGFQVITIRGCTQVDSANKNVTAANSATVPIWSPSGGSTYPPGAISFYNDTTFGKSLAGQTYTQHLFSNSTECGAAGNPSYCAVPFFQSAMFGSGSATFWSSLFGYGGSLNSVYFMGELEQFPTYCTGNNNIGFHCFSLPEQFVETALYANPAIVGCTPGLLFGCTGGLPNVSGQTGHVILLAQVENWNVYWCLQASTGIGVSSSQHAQLVQQGFASQSCVNFIGAVKAQNTGWNFGIFAPIITFFIGLALLFLGLGINLSAGGNVVGTGSQGSIGSNPQGTKLAQVFGVGLLSYSFVYSQFGTWITPTVLPWGIDTLVLFLIPALFFFGLMWQTWSGSGGTSGD